VQGVATSAEERRRGTCRSAAETNAQVAGASVVLFYQYRHSWDVGYQGSPNPTFTFTSVASYAGFLCVCVCCFINTDAVGDD
jgi:hypothetical protein